MPIALIPARMGSVRFPGKVLAADTGRPMIAHVCGRAAAAPGIERVVVATDHADIRAAVERLGYDAVMTGEHANGTSRLAEAATVLGLGEDDVVVNVQGDEPEVEPATIGAAVEALGRVPGVEIGTVAGAFGAGEDPSSPDIVKVTTTLAFAGLARALYFSRSLIPHRRSDVGAGEHPSEPLRHAGIYAYAAGFLRRYAGLPETPLERTERLEQLRALEHGHGIGVAIREVGSRGVDTPGDYAAFVARWRAGGGVGQGNPE